MIIQSNLLNSVNYIKHGFFTKEVFSSTNKKWFNNNLIEENVKKELNRPLGFLHYDVENLVLMDQIHSNKVLEFENNKKILKCDGSITKKTQLVLGVRTADCVPLLITDTENKFIAAIHAGWRGAFSGVVENTIKKMKIMGSKVENIIVAIGPCIRGNSYEVDKNFYSQFIDKDNKNKIFFNSSDRENYYKFSLPEYVKNRLTIMNIDKIDDCYIDTFTDERFFSYRRSYLKNSEFGYILSLIVLES